MGLPFNIYPHVHTLWERIFGVIPFSNGNRSNSNKWLKIIQYYEHSGWMASRCEICRRSLWTNMPWSVLEYKLGSTCNFTSDETFWTLSNIPVWNFSFSNDGLSVALSNISTGIQFISFYFVIIKWFLCSINNQ